MAEERGHIQAALLTVSEDLEFNGLADGDVRVVTGATLILRGLVRGGLTVDEGAAAEVYGTVVGSIRSAGTLAVWGTVGGPISSAPGAETNVVEGAVVAGHTIPVPADREAPSELL